MSGIRLPNDDRMLEMEEVEGFLPTSPVTNGNHVASKRSGAAQVLVGAVDTCDRCRVTGKWGIFLALIVLALMLLLLTDLVEISFSEGNGGAKVGDFEQKHPRCSVCGKDKAVSNPSEIVDTVLFKDKRVTCAVLQQAGFDGLVSPTKCSQFPQLLDKCGCISTLDYTEEEPAAVPQPATTSPPEPAKVTPVPVKVAPEPAIKPPGPASETSSPKSVPLPVPPAQDSLQPPNKKGEVAPDDGGASFYPELSQVVMVDPPLTPAREAELAKEWGKWEFVDSKASSRPKDDYCGAFPNRDIPRDKFPANAWQTDTEYLKGFLDEALKLVDRSMEAILAEYGKGKKDMPNDDFDTRSKMFQLRFLDFAAGDRPHGKDLPHNGGETTRRSFDGLVRRVLHAVMTGDTLGVVLGGHSAAAGHGNHFQQSYVMQFHKVMEPILSWLGVSLNSRNLAHGGLGTLESALGARDVYGKDIDIMLWDSGMTEGRDGRAVDLFLRQALIAGDRVPLLYGGTWNLLQMLHDNVDADVGQFGQALDGIPETTDETQALTLPYASRYMQCVKERNDLCGANKFEGICWTDWDQYTPTKKQKDAPGGRASWHPGNRYHQIVGRCIAFTVLLALKEGLTKWNEAANYALPDDAWHVSAFYENIRTKVKNIDPGLGECFKGFKGFLPARFCTTPTNARTEFTPRSNAYETSIQSIIKPASEGFYDGSGIPHVSGKMVFTGPGPHNPSLDVPEGEIDVLAIVSNGRKYNDASTRQRRLGGDAITTDGGWFAQEKPGFCDGTWNMECDRTADNDCLLYGHADARGGFLFGGYSGWLVMTLKGVKEGLIVLKMETWHSEAENKITQGWKSVNNKRRNLRQESRGDDSSDEYMRRFEHHAMSFDESERLLKAPPPDYCDEYRFEYSIDGKVTSLTTSEFKEWSKSVQRVVEVQTILDDPNFTQEPRDVEIAIRQLGCAESTKKAMSLTHVYWA